MSDPRKPAAPAAAPDLREVNERLKELVASLKTGKERLAERPATTPVPLAGPAPEAVDLEKRRLQADLALAREALAHAQEERDRLRERVAELERENQRVCDAYVAGEERSTELTQLYVALERLHGGLAREEALAAVQEIVINLVGSEELAVFERSGGALAATHAFGVARDRLPPVRPGEGALGRAAEGRLYVAGREGPAAPGEEDLTAAIPLRAGPDVVGVLAIYRLLGHKPVLDESDAAVFELLSAHAGLALRLREPRGAAAEG